MPMVYTPAHINSEIFECLRSSKHTPSVSHSLDSSHREGAGKRPPPCQSPARWMLCQRAGDFWGSVWEGIFCHSTGCLRNRNVAGDFHRPYETQRTLHFTIQRTTLPQSRPLGVTAPSEREPGGLAPFTRVLANIRGYGRFSSPLRNSEDITLYHSTKDTPSVTPVGRASSLREGAGRACTIHRGTR